jgi:hypothetical protein
MRFAIWASLAVVALRLPAQVLPGRWHTDTSRHSIDLKELKSGGPGKDGIPAVDHPKFVSAGEARHWLDQKEPAIVVELGRESEPTRSRFSSGMN